MFSATFFRLCFGCASCDCVLPTGCFRFVWPPVLCAAAGTLFCSSRFNRVCYHNPPSSIVVCLVPHATGSVGVRAERAMQGSQAMPRHAGVAAFYFFVRFAREELARYQHLTHPKDKDFEGVSVRANPTDKYAAEYKQTIGTFK